MQGVETAVIALKPDVVRVVFEGVVLHAGVVRHFEEDIVIVRKRLRTGGFCGHRDIICLHVGIAAGGVRDREVHGVGAGGSVDVGRVLLGAVNDAVVLKVPGPRGRTAGREIGELHREWNVAARHISGEGCSRCNRFRPCP